MSNRIEPGRRPARDEVEAIYPLLPLQQGMLFHDLLTPGDQPYFRQVSFRIESDRAGFDPALCQQAWSDLIARHEALRSVFDFENTARLLQLVLKQGVTAFDEEDLAGWDEAAQAARIESFRAEDRGRGFDLRGGPLTRIRLFRLGGGRFEMVWSHAHIVLDGWSGSLLLAEFAELYAARREGRRPDLLPPPSLGTYLGRIAARESSASRRYWADLLTGYDSPAGLPRLGLNRPGAPYRPGGRVVTLSPERHRVLERLAARAGVTLNTVLVALWGVLLGRYADCGDVVFGSVVSGRTQDVDGIERMVGAFINTIPVRVAPRDGEGIVSLLGRLQAQAFDSLHHDHLPLSEIQARSCLPNGLLDHLLVFENYPQAEAAPEPALGFRVVSAKADERANYDFGLVVQPGPPLRIVFNYNAEAHSEAQIRRLGEQIVTLIDALAADPDRPVAQVDILGAAERADLAVFSAGIRRAPPPEETIVALWRAQVARTPERIALVWERNRLSYRELDERSDRLAAALRRLPGFGAEQPVGVLAERGGRRIVALLGILKAGGAYLPLTPALPDERLGFILGDTACRIVLTDGPGRARLDPLRPGMAAVIDALDADADEAAASVAPGDLAYILYTSGSTGQPKGVMVEHRGFVNMILGQIEGFGLGPDDRVLQVSSCSFDASLSEIFMALLSGGALVLAGSDTILDRTRLLAAIADNAITVAGLSPSLLSALDFADFPGLRLLISAGEAVDPASARHYAARLCFINAYGPTEASVCASFHEVRADRPYPAGIPIGRPIPNTAIRILDRFFRPAPIGAVGEICLSGPGLARGYRNSADLTRAKFVGDGADRVYRTGDLGLWLEDGEIVYRGRRDGQVKLNGRRVELGEIEAALRLVPGIAQAAVIVTGAGEGGRAGRLVAYVVSAATPDPEVVRRQLAATLPSYMIPSALVTLADLPLTIAGKLDRKALPPPPAVEIAAPSDPPASPEEQAVAAAFETVLGCGPVGRGETFQALGGDSLAAIRVVGRLSKLGFELGLADLLGRQSVAAIGAVLAPRRLAAATAAPPASGEAPLTPIQAAFFADHQRGRAHFNHAILLKAAERIDGESLGLTLAVLWRRHDALRLRFHIGRDGVTQSAADPHRPPETAWVDLRGRSDPWGEMQADVATRHRGFDLATGPLLAAIVYRHDEGDFLALLAHHLVTDAVSWRFLLDDLAAFYRQARRGEPIALVPVGASYLDWARALHAYRDSGHLAARKLYWDGIDAAPLRRLATDGPVAPHGYDETGTMSVDLPIAPDLSDKTVQARLLTALAGALAAWDRPGSTRILLSSHGRLPIPGRALDVSRTIGWFTAEYPIVLTEAGGELDCESASALEYGVLRFLGPAATAAPRADIAFNYLGRSGLDCDPDAPFVWVPGVEPASVGRLDRGVPLEISASRCAGRADFTVRYCGKIHRPDTIRRLLAEIESVWAVNFRYNKHLLKQP